MSEPRVIKKYPNRRLYDTEISSYITLEDVRKLVIDGKPFCVRDAKSDREITRSILLQIIMEQEEDGHPIFSEEILSQFIRFYGASVQGMITSYLEKSLQMFVDNQRAVQDQVDTIVGNDPLTVMRNLTETNMSAWREMQESFLSAASASTRGRTKPDTE